MINNLITSNNQRLVKCIQSLVKVFLLYWLHRKKKVGVFSSRQPRKHLDMRSRLFVPHSQAVSSSKMAPNAWNRMASQSMPLGLVHKTLERDFRKNNTISMCSPSSNAITHFFSLFNQPINLLTTWGWQATQE